MADNRLSAREAAVIAQARAALEQKSADEAGVIAAAPPACSERAAPSAPIELQAPCAAISTAPNGAPPAPGLDAAERIAALMAAARAETERLRRRQKMLYMWVPVAFISVTGLWTLLWMWHKL